MINVDLSNKVLYMFHNHPEGPSSAYGPVLSNLKTNKEKQTNDEQRHF